MGKRQEGKKTGMILKRGKGFKRRKELGEKAKGGACRHVIQGLSPLQLICFFESNPIEVVEQLQKRSSEFCRCSRQCLYPNNTKVIPCHMTVGIFYEVSPRLSPFGRLSLRLTLSHHHRNLFKKQPDPQLEMQQPVFYRRRLLGLILHLSRNAINRPD